MQPLLTKGNPKTMKGEKFGYTTRILHLSPSTDNTKKVNLCPYSSAECVKACLNNSGRAGTFPIIKQARRRKSNLFIEHRQVFMKNLVREIFNAERLAARQSVKLAIRLNGTSDIRWARVKYLGWNIFTWFPNVQFYDYTKNPNIVCDGETTENYHVTFSWSGTNSKDCATYMKAGFNVAIPFQGQLPKYFGGYDVIDGDISDLRFLDEEGVIVGLRVKGASQRKTKKSSFLVTVGG